MELTNTTQPLDQAKSKSEARAGLLAYAADGRLPKLIALVKGFTSHHSPAGTTHSLQAAVAPSKHSVLGKYTSQQYPKHVSRQLYQTVCKYSTCKCTEDGSNRTNARKKAHLSRLRLRPFRNLEERFVCFDMVFSSRSTFPPVPHEIEWQHFQFQVSR